MKLLHFADVHLDAQFGWADHAVASRRREAIRQALVRILDIGLERQVDAILCAGDLFEYERITPDTVAFLRAQFARLNTTPVYISPGNHDHCSADSIYRQVTWPANVHIFVTDRLEPVTLEKGITLWGAAHLVPANTGDFLDGFRVDRQGVNLALFHGSERSQWTMLGEGKQPHAPFEAAELERAGIDQAMLGHYHKPLDAPRYTYPGNPEALTFGESGQRGAVLFTVGRDGVLNREHLAVGGGAGLHSINVDLTGCESSAECVDRAAKALEGLRGCARVHLTGEVMPAVSLQARQIVEAAPQLDAVLVEADGIRIAYDFDQIAAEHSVRGQFVADVRADETLEPNERLLILTAGLRALDGRADLEVC